MEKATLETEPAALLVLETEPAIVSNQVREPALMAMPLGILVPSMSPSLVYSHCL